METLSRYARAVLAGWLCLAGAAAAQVPDPLAVLTVREGWRPAPERHVAGLEIRMAQGWHTYWRLPGEVGVPPEITLSGSRNVAAARIAWPVPETIWTEGMLSLGYTDSVVLPIEITPRRAGQPVRLKGEIELGVCETLCVPVTLRFDAVLPPGGTLDAAIAAALADRPMTPQEAGAGPMRCELASGPKGLSLIARAELPPLAAEEVAVIEAGDPGIWVSPPVLSRQGASLAAEAELALPEGAALDRSALRMTVLAKGRAVEFTGCS